MKTAKSADSLKRGIAKVLRLWNDQEYALALQQVNSLLEQWPNTPYLLVMRADLTQLQDVEEGEPTLGDARGDLELAVILDEECISAWIELGYCQFVHEDDAVAAIKNFREAIRLSRKFLKDALIGQAKALLELERDAEAMTCLAEAYTLTAKRDDKRRGAEILEELRHLRHAR